MGVTRLEVDSDPNADGFYRAMRMGRTGRASSGSIAGRMLPDLVKDLAPARAGHGTVARDEVHGVCWPASSR